MPSAQELPFAAHAWVEADGELVGEPGGMDTYRRLIVVGRQGDVSDDVG
ncbi:MULTISPECIES: lasso peptide biosynthesis protein [unclassified Nocardia]